MKPELLHKELQLRESKEKQANKEVRAEDLLLKLMSKEGLKELIAEKEGIFTSETAIHNFLLAHPGTYQVQDVLGDRFECSFTPESVHVPSALKKVSVKSKQVGADETLESPPALLHQVGLYLTPPHGRLIAEGKKTAIVKSFHVKTHLNEQLYLLSGKLCYGIIRLREPKVISIKEFKSRAGEHLISEVDRKKWWPDYTKLYFYKFDLVRKYDPPKEYKYQKGPQVFVRNVQFLQDPNDPVEEVEREERKIVKIEREALTETPEKKEDEPTHQEVIEIQKKSGNWYLVKQPEGKDFRYVAQIHRRGQSVHTDLRLEANGHLVGWTLDTPSLTAEGLESPQAKYAETKYNRFLYPRDPSITKDFQILVQQKLSQPKIWLTVEGKIPEGGIGATKFKPAEFKIISSGRARFGTSKTDFNEIFLKPDKKWNQDRIAGRWVITYIPRPTKYVRAGEGKMMWAMFRPDEQRPYVATHNLQKEVEKAKREGIDMLWQYPDGRISEFFKGIEK